MKHNNPVIYNELHIMIYILIIDNVLSAQIYSEIMVYSNLAVWTTVYIKMV